MYITQLRVMFPNKTSTEEFSTAALTAVKRQAISHINRRFVKLSENLKATRE